MKTICVIGLGSIGMRHARNLRKLGHHVWGVDPDVKRRSELGYELSQRNTDHVAGADAFVVASPTEHHLDHLSYAINLGKPVLIEKPISDKWPTAVEEMLAVAKAPVMMGNNLRFHPCVIETKRLLTEREPIWASFVLAQYTSKEPYLRDGVISNWGAHEIDLALHLLGPAKLIGAGGDERMADLVLKHDNGCQTTIHLDYVTRPQLRKFTILDTDGEALRMNLVEGYGHGACTSYDFRESSFDDTYVDEMRAFIDLIDGKTVPHAATGADGLATLEIILEAKRLCGL